MITTQINAQGPQIQTGNWKDGNPFFRRTIPVENVRLDTVSDVISLIPTTGFNQ